MTILYFFTLLIAVPFLIFPFLKEKHEAFMWIGSFLGVSILTGLGTYKSCVSGWVSPSIGSRGACSHHGGVTSNMNDSGYVILGVCLIFLLIKFLIYQKKEALTEKAKVNKKNATNSIKGPPKRKLEDYEKYISVWHSNGLSIDEIVIHLRSQGIQVSEQDVLKHIDV